MKVRFERATIEDAEELIDIRNQCFHSDYIKYGECPGYNVSKENMINGILNNVSYKIIYDNKVIGNISARDNQDNTCYLGCICIIPGYENKGIGQESLKFIEREFPKATVWRLETPLDKEKNHYFYKKAGYTIVKEYMNGSVKVVMFEKKINSKNNKNLIIRNAEVKDAKDIIMLVKQVMNEAPFFPRTSEEFNFTIEQEEEYIKEASLFLIAEIEGKVVGSATLDRSELVRLNHTASFGITILKEYSHQGVGTSLMKKVIEWSELNNIEKIDLEVFEDNIPAILLYKKFGFIEEGIKRKAIKTEEGYKDIIIMCRFKNPVGEMGEINENKACNSCTI